MAMMCTAAMLTGAAAPVWAADAKTEESAEEAATEEAAE